MQINNKESFNVTESNSNNSELPHSSSSDKPNTKKRLQPESSMAPSAPTKKNKQDTTPYSKPPLTFAGEVFLSLNKTQYFTPIPSLSFRSSQSQPQETKTPSIEEKSKTSIGIRNAANGDSISVSSVSFHSSQTQPQETKTPFLPENSKTSIGVRNVANGDSTSVSSVSFRFSQIQPQETKTPFHPEKSKTSIGVRSAANGALTSVSSLSFRPSKSQPQETKTPSIQENSQAPIWVWNAENGDSTSVKTRAPKVVKKTTDSNEKHLDLINVLNEIGTEGLLKKLSNGAKGYNLSNYKIKDAKKDEFISAIQKILDIDKADLVEKNEVYISRDTIEKYFKKFEKKVKPLLVPKDDERELLILKLFVRAFSIPIVEAIRKYNIPLINMDDYTGEAYSVAVAKLLSYHQEVPTENNSFALRFSGKGGSTISDRFIIHEISNTRKKMNKSNQETWDDDVQLHMSIFPALDKFIKAKADAFENKHIKQQINRRSPATHFRPKSVIDLYNYLVQENIINANTAINFFDSSIGWLDRLTAALLCNNGKAFKAYVGFDPNPNVITAGNQLVADLKPKYNPAFNAQLYQQGIETADSKEIVKRSGGYFSFAFTSPPFFAAQEKYGLKGANENAQVWRLYNTKDQYKRGFLKPLLETNFNILTAGGVFGLHFKEKELLADALELINKDINNASMHMKVWREGVYYPKGGETKSSEIIYLFRRPNRIEEIPTPLISVEEENANKSTSVYFHSDASLEGEHEDDGVFFEETLNQGVNQSEALVPQVSAFSSRMVFFSPSSLNQNPADSMPAQLRPRTTPRN